MTIPRLAAVALVLAARAAGAQASTPAQPSPAPEAVAAVGAHLERVLSDTSLRAVDAFLAARRSPRRTDEFVDAQRALLRELVAEGAPLVVKSHEATATGRIVELWSARRARGVTVAYSVDREHPATLWNLQALRTVIPEAAVRPLGSSAADVDELAVAIRGEVLRLGAVGMLSGQVLVARHGQVIVHEAVGVRDTSGALMRPSSPMGQASIPKMLVAITVAQLVEQGRLRWDDSLTKLLPELPWHPSAHGVTLRALLTHQAGYGPLWDVPGFDASREYTRMTDIAALIAPRAVQPSSGFSYSNEGFELLASVVEVTTGLPYHEQLGTAVLRPSGVTRAFHTPSSAALAERAAQLPGSPSDPLTLRPRTRQSAFGAWKGTGAGGGYATAEEWHRILSALHDGRLVGRAIRDSLFTARVPMRGGASQSQYGFGFFVEEYEGVTFVGHGGGGPYSGVCNEIRSAVDGSWTVIVLTNVDPPACQQLTEAIVRARPRGD